MLISAQRLSRSPWSDAGVIPFPRVGALRTVRTILGCTLFCAAQLCQAQLTGIFDKAARQIEKARQAAELVNPPRPDQPRPSPPDRPTPRPADGDGTKRESPRDAGENGACLRKIEGTYVSSCTIYRIEGDSDGSCSAEALSDKGHVSPQMAKLLDNIGGRTRGRFEHYCNGEKAGFKERAYFGVPCECPNGSEIDIAWPEPAAVSTSAVQTTAKQRNEYVAAPSCLEWSRRNRGDYFENKCTTEISYKARGDGKCQERTIAKNAGAYFNDSVAPAVVTFCQAVQAGECKCR